MLTEVITFRIDKKLKRQLIKYAQKDDEGKASRGARRLLKNFFEEQSLLEQQRQANNPITFNKQNKLEKLTK
ncbi:MAG: hypothetical protein GY870_06870 [archaeon]|nr:hypothetical protein [archaeon]